MVERKRKAIVDYDLYKRGTKNLEIFINKTVIGIQQMFEDHEAINMEINEFIKIERPIV